MSLDSGAGNFSGETAEPIETAPAEGVPELDEWQPIFYRINSGKLTLAEFCRLKPGYPGFVAWLLGRLGTRLSLALYINVDSLVPFEVDERAIPRPVYDANFKSRLNDLTSLGFASPRYYFVKDPMHSSELYLTVLPHSSGRAMAMVFSRIWGIQIPPRILNSVSFVSERMDGTFVGTDGSKLNVNSPPALEQHSLGQEKMTPPLLWSAHQGFLTARRADGSTPPPVRMIASTEETEAALERLHAVRRDYYLSRGLYVPLSAADAHLHSVSAAAHQQASDAGTAHADVLAAMSRMQVQSGTRRAGLLIFFVSVALYVIHSRESGPSSEWITTRFGAIVYGVILFHELGHFITMRIFGYRNVRMVFLPGFGAMVRGKNYNVPGWRKVVVALMGPLPGIGLGIVIGAIGLVTNNSLCTQIAVASLGVNGFNLLPVPPLDGGKVAQALLFSRFWPLNGLFCIAGGGLVLWFGMTKNQPIFTFIGAIVAISAPRLWQNARIAAELRAQGISPLSPDDQSIPPATADAIVTRLRAGRSRAASVPLLARQALGVFEAINSRPLGWLATFGFGALHVTSFLAAALFLVVFLAHGSPVTWLRNLTGGYNPSYVVTEDSMQADPGPDSPPPGSPTNVVVATFSDITSAHRAYFVLADQIPLTVSRELFGQSILMSVPASDDDGRRHWLDYFRPKAVQTIVVTPGTQDQFRLVGTASDEADAKDAIDELDEYTMIPTSAALIPPWRDPDSRSPQQIAANRLARQTYMKLIRLNASGFDPGFQNILARQRQAAQDGDEQAMKNAEAEREKYLNDAKLRALAKLESDNTGTVDQEMVRLYKQKLAPAAHSTTNPSDESALYVLSPTDPMAVRMGQLELTDGKPSPAAAVYSAEGFSSSVRSNVRLFFTFTNVFSGPPALVRWLDAKGFTEIKYTFDTPQLIRPDDGSDEP